MDLDLEAGSGIPEQEAWALARHGNLLARRGVRTRRRAYCGAPFASCRAVVARTGYDPDALAAKLTE